MGRDAIIDVLLQGGSYDDLERSFARARAAEELERRERFTAFGAPKDSSAPAAWVYHQHSRITPTFHPMKTEEELVELTLDLGYRRYPGSERVALARGGAPIAAGLEDVLLKRRSVRRFSEDAIRFSEISKILELAGGVTAEIDQVPRRSYPSGGALYPVEIYPLAISVEGLSPGVYHYATLDHALERRRPLSGLDEIHRAAPQLISTARPPLIFVLSVVLERSAAKYLERGYRFALLEAGHLAQNILLVAIGLGLDAVCIGGFFDDDLNALLQLPSNEEVAVYGVLIGRARAPAEDEERRQ